MADILFKTDDYIFSYRVGGVLIHNDKMLLQRVLFLLRFQHKL